MVYCEQATRYVHCPTCRQKAPVADIAFVDARRIAAKEAGSSSREQHEEEKLYVRGSYSTKVRIILHPRAQTPSIQGALTHPQAVGLSRVPHGLGGELYHGTLSLLGASLGIVLPSTYHCCGDPFYCHY